MTIEIRQLIIRALVDERIAAGPGPGLAADRQSGFDQPPAQVRVERSAEDRQAIVSACVREVLRKLERARER